MWYSGVLNSKNNNIVISWYIYTFFLLTRKQTKNEQTPSRHAGVCDRRDSTKLDRRSLVRRTGCLFGCWCRGTNKLLTLGGSLPCPAKNTGQRRQPGRPGVTWRTENQEPLNLQRSGLTLIIIAGERRIEGMLMGTSDTRRWAGYLDKPLSDKNTKIPPCYT